MARSQLADLDEVGRSKPCGGKKPARHLYENMKNTHNFKIKHLNEIHKSSMKYTCNSKLKVQNLFFQASPFLSVARRVIKKYLLFDF